MQTDPTDFEFEPALASLKAACRSPKATATTALKLVRTLNAACRFEESLAFIPKWIHRTAPEDAVYGNLLLEEIRAASGASAKLDPLARKVKKQVKAHNELGWPHRNVALIHHLAGAEKRASQAIKLALARSKDEGTLEIAMLISSAKTDLSEFQKQLRQALHKAPKSFILAKVMGDSRADSGEDDKAIVHYLDAIRRQPLYVDAWHSLGSLLLGSDGFQEKSRRCFDRALSINPKAFDVHFTLIEHHVDACQFDEARVAAGQALALDPSPAVMAELENYLGYIDSLEGDHNAAEKHYREALALDPAFGSPWHNLGLVYVHRKDFESAASCFKKAIARNPERSWSYTKLGLAYFELKKYEKAEELFHQALEINESEYGAHLGLAEIYRKKRRHDLQLEACLAALDVEPNQSNVRNYLGIAYECNKQPKEAETQYLKALDLDSRNRWAANNLGYLYEKLLKQNGSAARKKRAIAAWKVRLLICRDTRVSTLGAHRHLTRLGVPEAAYERVLRRGRLEEALSSLQSGKS